MVNHPQYEEKRNIITHSVSYQWAKKKGMERKVYQSYENMREEGENIENIYCRAGDNRRERNIKYVCQYLFKRRDINQSEMARAACRNKRISRYVSY